jgi:hypothetical protein
MAAKFFAAIFFIPIETLLVFDSIPERAYDYFFRASISASF